MDEAILSSLGLSPEQRAAACQYGCDTAVLAGAGCGKTATLVGHYLYLLARGLAPERLVAITFTERAGKEMRARIRRKLQQHLMRTGDAAARSRWLDRYVAIDESPIGTIHSLCARLLRAHPAEAGLDPRFVVLEENQAGALQAEAVQRALAWAGQDASAAPCFRLLGGPDGLRRLLALLLARRLEVQEALVASQGDVLARWVGARYEWLHYVVHSPEWEEHLRPLEALEPFVPGDALDALRLAALQAVRQARACIRAGDWGGALRHLGAGLRSPGNVGTRQSWGDQAPEVRRRLKALSELYRRDVVRIVERADPSLDEALAAAWPGLVALFGQALEQYRALKAERQAVDFDDLEAGALRLLQANPEVAAYHQGRIQAVLVDEFQDTNDRQRRLIEALLGAPAGQSGRLFIVGDAKQSIYRFRGADVTVFRSVESEIRGAGGRACNLQRSYRAHAGLVDLLNGLLAGVLGREDDPRQPYRVPFAPLVAERAATLLQPPFVELHLGIGPLADDGRRVAAEALARRLARLHEEEGVGWGHMACLFRATTNFPIYEAAFEQAGIPYVTVAGTGFLNRPEVRDLLNALRTLASPNDDLAMAGLLRSPAIGLTDASLYLLRRGADGQVRGLATALAGDLSALDPEEQARARRAAAILGELAPQVGREPVAAVLKRFLDLTGYQAILRLYPGGERASRNVDKLLADAHRSAAVSVGDMLAYVQALRDTAAREGEAPPEAGEAVQLMSVHRAKGLEFGVVVIADAAHDDSARVPQALVHPRWGLLVRVSRAEGSDRREGLAHGLARRDEEEMQDAEERRLLYVAATRASEKLLVSAHATRTKAGLALHGWVKRIAAAIGDEWLAGATAPGADEEVTLSLWQGRITCTLYELPEGAVERPAAAPPAAVPTEAPEVAPVTPLVAPCQVSRRAPGRAALPERVWRVVPRSATPRAPQWVIGALVHLGLRLWQPADDPRLAAAMGARARQAGLTDPGQIRAAVKNARDLIRRFQQSDFCAQLDAAERWHEVPYALRPGVDPWGRIDLLCRLADGQWWLVDFKVHRLSSAARLDEVVDAYREQLQRYRRAVRELLGQDARALLCFLNYCGGILVRELEV
ncbi:MAG: UvrD-helicase domain-containing protein [Anaerolineae bacterium]|nr:UvrD-helicase domain-containing protein [Anaerolineae bacterium]